MASCAWSPGPSVKHRARGSALQPIAAVRALGVVEAQIPLALPLQLPRLREVRPAEHHPPELGENRSLQPLDEPIRPRVARQRAAVLGLHRRSDGAVLNVHEDVRFRGRLISARVFISLLSPDRAFACVDGELPVSQDGQPVIALGADTLFVLKRSAGQQRATTYLNAYTIDDSTCAWLPIPGQPRERRPATKGGARSG